MKHSDFDLIVEKRKEQITAVLARKSKEYSSEDDRFHNFKRAAVILETTQEKALAGMLVKHMVSVLDIVNNPDKFTANAVDEKIGDSINYLILLEGTLYERMATKVLQPHGMAKKK
jgi:hypothetical protein